MDSSLHVRQLYSAASVGGSPSGGKYRGSNDLYASASQQGVPRSILCCLLIYSLVSITPNNEDRSFKLGTYTGVSPSMTARRKLYWYLVAVCRVQEPSHDVERDMRGVFYGVAVDSSGY